MKNSVIIKDIKKITKENKKLWTLYFLSCFLPSAVTISLNTMLSILIGIMDMPDTRDIVPTIVIAGILAVMSGIFKHINGQIKIKYISEIMPKIRAYFFDKLVNLRYQKFSEHSRDDYLSFMTGDLLTFESKYFEAYGIVIENTILFLVSLALIFYIEMALGIALAIFTGLIFGANIWIKRLISKRKIEKANRDAKYSIKLANIINGRELIKSDITAVELKNRMKRFIKSQEGLNGKLRFLEGLQQILMQHSTTVGLMISLLYITYQISNGAIAISKLVFVILFVNVSISSIVALIPALALKESEESILNNRVSKYEEKDFVEGQVPFYFKDKIEVENLSFRYNENNIIYSANFQLKKHGKYLVLGESGSGKTTLMNIMAKIYNNYKGNVFIDGVELRSVNSRAFNDNIAFISQDVFLFDESVRENICLFRHYEEEEVLMAIHLAQLDAFVANLRDGLQTKLIENGKEISGGERRRIGIARAILQNPQIIFADEMTAHLDMEQAKQIEEVLVSLNTTIISIAHRSYLYSKEFYDGTLAITKGHITFTKKRKVLSANTESQVIL